MARMLVLLGLGLLAVGLLWPVLGKLGLGRLPGDVVIERDGWRLYLPLTSCLLVSVVLSLLIWLFRR